MLKPACRRFRSEFTPGTPEVTDPHRQACPACAAYAAAMERAARRLPLPEGLRSRLRAIPAASGDGPRMPLPQAPLPGALRDRLRGIARVSEGAEPPPLPVWVRTSRYAVAASYVLALLVGAAIGNPLDLGRDAADALSTSVVSRLERALEGAEEQGRDRLDALESTVLSRYGETRRSVEESLGSLESRVDELQSLISLDTLDTLRRRMS